MFLNLDDFCKGPSESGIPRIVGNSETCMFDWMHSNLYLNFKPSVKSNTTV